MQHLHPTLRNSRDVLGEIREAGVSEQSGSPLRLSDLIGWLLLDHPARSQGLPALSYTSHTLQQEYDSDLWRGYVSFEIAPGAYRPAAGNVFQFYRRLYVNDARFRGSWS